MSSRSKTIIEKEVDRQFRQLSARHGDCCDNPVTGGGFVWGIDPIAPQKKAAIEALLAREWFAVNGPPDAPPLPLNIDDRDHFRGAGGLTAIVGFYARSLSRQDYDVRKHPSFDDFACGLLAMAMETGLWGLENDQTLIRRFPPRTLAGMDPVGAYWDPLKRKGARFAE
jgi:hypothetical protein